MEIKAIRIHQASGYPCNRQRWGTDGGYKEIKRTEIDALPPFRCITGS